MKIDRNLPNRQKSFETAITNVAQMFIDVSSWEPDNLTSKLEPQIHAKREEVLLHGEEVLNSFQVTIFNLASDGGVHLTRFKTNPSCVSE
jgi:hypothetical protein